MFRLSLRRSMSSIALVVARERFDGLKRLGNVMVSIAVESKAEVCHSDLESTCTCVGRVAGGSTIGTYNDAWDEMPSTDRAELAPFFVCVRW